MEDGLYHYEVYWSEEIQKQIDAALNSGLPLKFDDHAIKNKYKRSISISGITTEKLKKGYCFEAGVKNNKVVKFVIRYGYDDVYDLCSVWKPTANSLYCITIWLNEKDDKHETLDGNNYVADNTKSDVSHLTVSLGDLIRQQKNNK